MADRNDVERAIRYVAEFSLRVDEQKRWIGVLRRQGHPTAQAESLLIAFEDSLSLAKKHLILMSEAMVEGRQLPAAPASHPEASEQSSEGQPRRGADNATVRGNRVTDKRLQTVAPPRKRTGKRTAGRLRKSRAG